MSLRKRLGFGARGRGWEVLLLTSSLFASTAFAAAAYREHLLAPWRSYQSAYRDELIARAADDVARKNAEDFQIRHYQYFLPDLNRIDRCGTCHVSIGDAKMADAAQPLRAHPGELLLHHPPDRFGCTICHGGQGRATEAVEAHGHLVSRPAPMREGGLLQGACAQCHWDPELPEMEIYNLGRSLFAQKACLSCHHLRGSGGAVGPDITAIATVHTFDWHVEHFLDPQATVPGSQMPNLELSREEAEALAYLMMGLTGEFRGGDYVPGAKSGGVNLQDSLSLDSLGANVDPEAAEGYVGSETCLICHDGLHQKAMEGWKASPMAHAFQHVRDVADRERCVQCHATGFNPATQHYSEMNVTCEACHGPGKEYVPFVLGGKISKHRETALGNVRDQNVCIRCHNPHEKVSEHVELMRSRPLPAPAPEGISGD